jgi:ferredoxin
MSAKVESGTCTGCEVCVPECPVDAISMLDGKAVVNTGECTDCGACVPACPPEAISME